MRTNKRNEIANKTQQNVSNKDPFPIQVRQDCFANENENSHIPIKTHLFTCFEWTREEVAVHSPVAWPRHEKLTKVNTKYLE